jgi:hypothetical protein
MIVDLKVDPTRLAEFDSFYHDLYIPEFLAAVPEIATARRYAQRDDSAVADPSSAHYLTIYELSANQATTKVEAAIEASAHANASNQFKLWKQDGLTYFDRAFYKEICRHGRQPRSGCWHNHSLYALRWIQKPDGPGPNEQFHWVEYFNREKTKVKDWLACRTYMRVDSEPPAFLTVFEATDPAAIVRALLRSYEDFSEDDQTDFANWLQQGIAWHDCMMLEPIFYLSNAGDD